MPRPLLILCCAASISPGTLFAQPQGLPAPEPFTESVTLDTDSQVEKKLGTVRDYLAEQQWEQAIEILRDVARRDGDTLMEVEPGRYTNTARYVNMVLAGLPHEGLSVYRQSVDPEAKARLEEGRNDPDDAVLERLVERTFASSYGDDALLLLGDRAWERGQPSRARRFWTQLVPLQGDFPLGAPLPRLRYPDPSIPQADVLARLVLATLLERDTDRAAWELAVFAKQFPNVKGTLAGRSGKYVDLLQHIARNATGWEPQPADRHVTTFAGTASRQYVVPSVAPPTIGRRLWSAPLDGTNLKLPTARPALHDDAPLSCFPVTWNEVVFVNEGDQILAFDARTGEPWPEGNDTPRLYPGLASRAIPRPDRPVMGVPRFSMTVDGGRLYARMGSPVSGVAKHELQPLRSEIVCLDLRDRQGDLLYRIAARDLQRDGEEGWSFEGTPVVHEGRVYVALRRVHPQTQIRVACLEPEPASGEFRVVWNEPACSALSHVDENQNVITHLLLTCADDSLYLSTDLGAVLAIDTRQGRVRWAVTYPSTEPESPAAASDDTGYGLVPPLVHRGVVYAAPNDTQTVFAIDAATGVVRWRRTLPDRVRHLLGAGHDRLVLGGDSLWGLDVHTGEVAWGSPVSDPASHGYGRGLLVGDHVWWPTHRRVHVVRQRDGRPVRPPIELAPKGGGGGNLLLVQDVLVVVEPERISAYGPRPGVAPQSDAPRWQLSGVSRARRLVTGLR